MNLKYDSLNQQLRDQLPVLGEPRYTELIGGIEAGPYIVFGVMFNQYLADLAKEADPQARSGAAAFMEDMAVAEDERVSDMLGSEVLPTLVGSQSMVDAYWPVLGAATRRRLKLLSPRLTARIELPALQ